VWGVALIVSIAVVLGMVFKGVSGESVSDAVKDLGAALIPILSAVLAARLVTREMDPAERFLQMGEEALRGVQRQHPDLLSGPKANRENYDPENPGKAGRYLFFQKGAQGKKGQFVPIPQLKEGIVEIRVPKTTLLLLGWQREGLEQVQLDVLATVRRAVEDVIKERWTGACEVLEHKHADIAIVVDFDEAKLGPRKFSRAVTDCVEAAFVALRQAAAQ